MNDAVQGTNACPSVGATRPDGGVACGRPTDDVRRAPLWTVAKGPRHSLVRGRCPVSDDDDREIDDKLSQRAIIAVLIYVAIFMPIVFCLALRQSPE